MLLVSVERNRYIQERRAQTHAEAVLPSAAPVEGRLQYLWKSFRLHDEDGSLAGTQRERIGLVTVLRVDGPLDVRVFELDIARGCGFKTTQAFQGAWDAVHPRSPEAVIVWFVLGDWRDRDIYLNWSGRAGGDYTRNAHRAMDSDAPALTREEIDALSSVNRQKDEARRAKASQALASETPSQRLQRIYRYIEHLRVTVGEEAARQASAAWRQEERIIKQRIARAEGRRR